MILDIADIMGNDTSLPCYNEAARALAKGSGSVLPRDNYAINIYHAVAGAIAINMIQPFISIFAIRLGATDLQLGYLSSWPNLASIIAVLGGAVILRRTGDKQRTIAAFFLLGRLAFLGAASVPWWNEEARLWVLVWFWVLALFPQAAANTGLQSYLTDLFPAQDRASVFAARSRWGTAAAMLAGLAAGWGLDLLPYPGGYQWMFAAATVVAAGEIWLFMKLRDPWSPLPEDPAGGADGSRGWRAMAGVIRSDHRYVRFVLVSLFFHFTWQMAWPIFARYQVSVLLADNTWTSIITVTNSLGAVIAYPIWTRYAAKYGNLPVLRYAALWLALTPVVVALSPNLYVLALVNFFTGMGLAGTLLLVLQSMLERCPQQDRPVYLAVHQALVSISGAAAPIAGAALMTSWSVVGALYTACAVRLLGAVVLDWLHRTERRVAVIEGIGSSRGENLN